MPHVLYVGLGGALGAMLRYGVSAGMARVAPASVFPAGTMTVNLVGCLAIGFLATYLVKGAAVPPQIQLLILVGLLGGFTTFSSFAWETLGLVEQRHLVKAGVYVLVSNLVGFGAAWVGTLLAGSILKTTS